MIPNPAAFLVAVACLVVSVASAGVLAAVWADSRYTMGEITAVETRAGSCGRSGPCTVFLAVVRYEVEGGSAHTTRVEVGRASGAGRPASDASARAGSQVPIRYVRSSPGWVLPESREAALACPSSTAVIGGIALVVAFVDPRSRKRLPGALFDR